MPHTTGRPVFTRVQTGIQPYKGSESQEVVSRLDKKWTRKEKLERGKNKNDAIKRRICLILNAFF